MDNLREKLIKLLCEASSLSVDAELFEDSSYAQQLEIEADHLIANGVTVQQWIPVNDPPKETGQYLVNIHQEDSERGEEVDFVLDAWYQVNGLLFVPDTVGWTLLNEWYDLSAQMRPYITHWMPRPEPPKEV